MLVRGKYIIVKPDKGDQNGILLDGAVLVRNGIIQDVGKFDLLKNRHPGEQIIGSDGYIVGPGLINAHHHGRGISMIEMGLPDDSLEFLMFSLLAEPWTDPSLSAVLSGLRLIETGVTTVIHFHRHYGSPGAEFIPYREVVDRTVEGYLKTRLRVAFAMDARDRPALVYGDLHPLFSELPDGLKSKVERLAVFPEKYNHKLWFAIFDDVLTRCKDTNIRLLLGPLTAHSCTEKFLVDLKRKAEKCNTRIHIHTLETPYNIGYPKRQYGKRQLEYFKGIGFLGPELTLIHSVWVSEDDIRLIKESGTQVVTCPSSNLRLRSGIAPVNHLIQAGVTLGLGMDGITINDEEDMFAEMRLLKNLHRVPGHEEYCPDSDKVFEIATEGGARTAGLWEITGSIAKGKAADLVLMKTDELTTPFMKLPEDLIDVFVLRGRPRYVDTVMVAGEIVYQQGRHASLNPAEIRKQIIEMAKQKLDESKIELKSLYREIRPYLMKYYRGWKPGNFEPYYTFNARQW